MKFTGPSTTRFDDVQQEKQRKNFEARIVELQKTVAAITVDQGTVLPSDGAGGNATTKVAVLTTVAPGRYLNRQIFTTASGVYTSTPGTNVRYVKQVGGGGGGGGANGTVGSGDAAGAGGNSGWCIEYRVFGQNLSGTFVCGAAGVGGVAAAGNGGTGGDTTLTINGQTYVAKGGTGGLGALNTNQAPTPPAAQNLGNNIDLAYYGTGFPGTMGTGGLVYSGTGGSVHPLGSGGFSVNASLAAGGVGLGHGGGGGGAAVNFFSLAGSVGASGAIIIDEYT